MGTDTASTDDAVTADILAVQPSKTYAIDFDSGEMSGEVDGARAVKQYVTKAVQTARYRHPIYGFDYGCELEDLIGQDVSAALLLTEIPRIIKEAIIYDERISDVSGFTITRDTDKLYVSFFVSTDDETIPIEITV